MTIYVAGPYRSRWGLPGRLLNIYRAWRAARWYWRHGYRVVCPHANSALMDGCASDEDFLQFDRTLLERCAVLAYDPDRWRDSAGTCAEIALAHDLGIPCVPWYTLPRTQPSRVHSARCHPPIWLGGEVSATV
jgi:hypothetical protein